MTARFNIGIDIGGTFTDLVAFDERTGQTVLLKVPSTPHNPSEGAITAIKELAATHPGEIEVIVHATTIGTNLFLGQTGLNLPKGALITTKGFRDVLEIGRQRRPELYNLFFKRPAPLIPRHLRFEIDERTNFTGEVLKPIDEGEVLSLANELRKERIETIAIVFLHSYANPAHEKRVREILDRELPEAIIVASHEVDPTYREYERTSTTVVNSLLIPVVSAYLEKMGKRLAELNIRAPFYIMQSSGGLATARMASRLPAATIESGPATGVIATEAWGQALNKKRLLSFDMGGTTAKAGTVIEGTAQMVPECEVGGTVHSGRSVKGSGYPVRYPFIDLAEVSGGGGTIAWVEQGSALKVGPQSAGADPGPACYGKGGQHPTVTDANLVLGRLNPKGLSGGAIPVFPELAQKTIGQRIADPLGMSIEQASHGILEIVNTHMMRALRLVSIERGHDPRQFALVAFGGAGPMHAAFLAEAMGMKEVFVPPHPGVFSAFGLLLADFRYDLTRSVLKDSSRIGRDELAGIFDAMEKEGLAALSRDAFPSRQIRGERHLAMRYVGQSYELMIPFERNLEEAIKRFHRRHSDTYGYASPDEGVEVVSVHLALWVPTGKPAFRKTEIPYRMPAANALMERRPVYFAPMGWTRTPVYARGLLLPGNWFDGPAMIEEYDATTIVPPMWNAAVDKFSNLCLKRGT
ncbi:MAG: hydantoinase/oxoprolinase family protein [Chloroflexi bacterium]|nr:hydantoinase/oxoprolinase family protein [Chloroflexota bacterium]